MLNFFNKLILKKLFKQSGFSIIEVMIGSTLSLGGMLAVGTAVQYVSEKNKNSQYISSMISLEFEIVSAFISPDNYTPTDITALASGTVPTAVKIKTLNNFTPELPLGTSYLTEGREGTTPRAFCDNFKDKKCIFKVDLDIRKKGDLFFYAYRINLNPQYGAVLNLGASNPAPGASTLFEDADYNFQIPVSIYPPPVKAELDCAKQTNKTVAAGILDDKLICINKPRDSDKCPPATIAKYLEVINDSGEKYLKLNCQPTKVYCCPNDYVLQRFDLRSSDPAGSSFSSNNTCVFAAGRTAPSSPITKGPGFRVQGQVCPPKYRSTSTCSLVAGAPALCSASISNSGRRADCSVQGLITDCHDARVSINVRCELDVAETVAATAHTGTTCPAQIANVYTPAPTPAPAPAPAPATPVFKKCPAQPYSSGCTIPEKNHGSTHTLCRSNENPDNSKWVSTTYTCNNGFWIDGTTTNGPCSPACDL